jgi:hypothetical protein
MQSSRLQTSRCHQARCNQAGAISNRCTNLNLNLLAALRSHVRVHRSTECATVMMCKAQLIIGCVWFVDPHKRCMKSCAGARLANGRTAQVVRTDPGPQHQHQTNEDHRGHPTRHVLCVGVPVVRPPPLVTHRIRICLDVSSSLWLLFTQSVTQLNGMSLNTR